MGSPNQPVAYSFTLLPGLDWFKPLTGVGLRWFGVVWLHGLFGFAPDNTPPTTQVEEQYFTSPAWRANWGKGVRRLAYVQIDPRSGRAA
jgi:hypothetical protein